MQTTIYLIRHGSIHNPQDIYYGRTVQVELTEQGKKELEIVAEIIKKQATIKKIYTSPIKRAVDSARILKNCLNGNSTIIIEEDFNEVDVPAVVNKPITLRYELFRKDSDEYSKEFVLQGNESREQIAERMLRGLKQVVEENRGNSAIIVSHGDPIRFLLFALENPNREIPSMSTLINSDYLERGEAWKIVLDEDGSFVNKKLLTYRKV